MIGSSDTMRSEASCRGRTRRTAWTGPALLSLVLFSLGLSLPAHADDHATRPIRIVVGAGAGGSLDVQVRIIAPELTKLLGQDIVIENRPGGGGVIAGQAVSNAPPDGNTLFAYAGDLFSVAALMPRTTFNANKQLVAISQISETPLLLITGTRSTFSDVKGLIAAANASPLALTYATFSVASVNNVVGQWIAREAHIKLLNVTFRTGSEAALATAAGDVSLAIVTPASVYPAMVNAGAVKIIGLTSARRLSHLPPSWPTLAESGLPIDATTYFGIFGPAGMSDTAIARLDHAFAVVLKGDAVRARLQQIGMFAKHRGSAEFAKRIETERIRYEGVIQDMHMIDAQR